MEEIESKSVVFLRFVDEVTWLTAARAAGFMINIIDEEGNETEKLQTYTSSHAIDVIGIITEGGEWDDVGNQIVAPTILDGYHINYVGTLPTGWESYEVKPSNPRRVFL